MREVALINDRSHDVFGLNGSAEFYGSLAYCEIRGSVSIAYT